MGHRTAIMREMEAYGLSPVVVEALGVPEEVDVSGLLAFRQGLAEAGNDSENPLFPAGLRETREYELGISVVGLYQQTREAA